ncbi:MAG: permease [Rickettsiales bacterium]|nr:permease [Rickettsiales bacterium]
MFQVYLPIAEMSVHALAIILLGGATGVLSGMLGVGGGFLTTPFLIFMGVPPTVSVATSANQIVAASVSGFLNHWRRKAVDIKMGNYLLGGGLVGSTLGIQLFRYLESLGQIDLVISLSYVIMLGTIGGMMGWESLRALMGWKKPKPTSGDKDATRWIDRWPMQSEFAASGITLSILLPLGIGFIIGVMVSIMGVGGGFFMIPAMIYILRMPASVVVGTSLYQIIFITANVTLLHAVTTQTVDIMLALLLLSGSVIGAQIGSRMGSRVSPDILRAIMAALVLTVAIRLAYDLFVTPDDLYSFTVEEPHA